MIELVIDNYDSGEHPIHVHGRDMYVMARGQEHSGPYNNISYPRNIVDPILRDTVTVPKNSSIGQSVDQYACLIIRWFTKLYVGSEVGYLRFHLLYTRLLLWTLTYIMHCTNNFYFSPLIFHC